MERPGVTLNQSGFLCDVARKPPRFAPHHPRLDHWLFYQGFGLASLRVACLTG